MHRELAGARAVDVAGQEAKSADAAVSADLFSCADDTVRSQQTANEDSGAREQCGTKVDVTMQVHRSSDG